MFGFNKVVGKVCPEPNGLIPEGMSSVPSTMLDGDHMPASAESVLTEEVAGGKGVAFP